jgi:hypothetical protein
MTIGAAYQGTCYPTAEQAAQVACMAFPVTGSDGGGPFVRSCLAYSDSQLTLGTTRGDGSRLDQSLALSFADCNTDSIQSAMPSRAGAVEAFSYGFTLVITCYLIAWGCGRILDGWKH